MHRIIRLAAGCGVVALLLALLPLAAAAHEHREVANGQYEMVVGFIEEPAFVGEMNGLYLRVEKTAAPEAAASPAAEVEEGTPVEGLADTLQAEVIFGDQRMPLTLEPAFRQPGVYHSVFFPTTPGDYTFHIFGQIEGNPVDETLTSAPGGFDSVQPVEPLQFPKPAASADSGVAAAWILAGFGGPAGALGLVAGAVLWVRQRRAGSPAATVRDAIRS